MLSKSEVIQAICKSDKLHFLHYLYQAESGAHMVIVRVSVHNKLYAPSKDGQFICKVFINGKVLHCQEFNTGVELLQNE